MAVAARVVALAAAPPPASTVMALPLTAAAVPLDPLDRSRNRVGGLRYMGGLVLKSTDNGFGGISGLRAGPGGRMLAITDTGNWVVFTVVERGGRLVGVKDGSIAPLLDETGSPAIRKEDGDAEGLEWDPVTGTAMVSFEQDHRIQHYAGIDPARPATLSVAPSKVTRDPATADWPKNGGGEAIAALSNGSRLVFEEDGVDSDGLSPVLQTSIGTTHQLAYRRVPSYKPTDAVEIVPGELLVLGRSFSAIDGISVNLSRVTVGPAMVAREVARLAPPLTIDNMEGLAVRHVGGRTFVYIVADDNFNAWEKILLLKFELLREARR